jgi:hypothetical protein
MNSDHRAISYAIGGLSASSLSCGIYRMNPQLSRRNALGILGLAAAGFGVPRPVTAETSRPTIHIVRLYLQV